MQEGVDGGAGADPRPRQVRAGAGAMGRMRKTTPADRVAVVRLTLKLHDAVQGERLSVIGVALSKMIAILIAAAPPTSNATPACSCSSTSVASALEEIAEETEQESREEATMWQ